MSRQFTPRLKLISESDDEIVDSFPYNWPLLDAAAGATVIADGATPANSSVFHGQLFRETTTGKSWIAKVNSLDGTYVKEWLTFPWECKAWISNGNITSGTADFECPMTTGRITAHCVNSTDADLDAAKRIILPITGIYNVDALARWQSNGSGARSVALGYNAAKDNISNIVQNPGDSQCVWVADTLRLFAGQTVSPFIWQNSGITLTVNVWLTIQLVSPV